MSRQTRVGLAVAFSLVAATFFAAVVILPSRVSGATLYVGGVGPGNYTTIQTAIDVASPGDTVYVYSGTYNELISITKTISLVGEDRNTTSIIRDPPDDAIYVNAESVIITGFTVIAGSSGVYLWNSPNSTIAGNVISNNHDGISTAGSRGSLIADNILIDNMYNIRYGSPGITIANNTIIGTSMSHPSCGICLYNTHATVTGNTLVNFGIHVYGDSIEYWNTHTIDQSNKVNGKPVYYWKNVTGGTVPPGAGQVILANVTGVVVEGQTINNTDAGISMGFSSGNTVVNNSVKNVIFEFGGGIYLMYSDNNTISRNNVSNGYDGIRLIESRGGMVADNILWDNGVGIFLERHSDNGTLSNNTIAIGGYGVDIWNSTNARVFDNNISGNNRGIRLIMGASGNRIYHNSMNANINQAGDDGSNQWDDGYPSGGNYWSDYTGADSFGGPNQDVPGSDGIGDTPYPIPDGMNEDRYPLMNPPSPGPNAPSEPWNLQAAAGNGMVTLTWAPPVWDGGSPVTNYTIYRGTTPGGETFLVELGNVLTFADTGLTNGVTYCYQIAAVNAVGEGPRSSEVCATPAREPGRPRQLNAVGGRFNVTLDWLPPANDGGAPITNYTIYRGLASGGETLLVTIGNVLIYEDTGLTSGVTYYYTVTATNVMGESPASTEASAAPLSLPTEPLNLQANPGNAQVVLAWGVPASDGGSPITNYRIYRGLTSGGETFLVQIGNVLTHTDTGLTNGQQYFYKVAAVNSEGEGALSSEASATPMTVPGPPTGVFAVCTCPNVTVEWQAPLDNGGSSITNYSIYRGTTPGGESLLATIGSMLQYTDSSVVNGQTYYYVVTAINAAGEGPRSLEVRISVPDHPTAPLNLLAASGNRQVTLMWDPPSYDGGLLITNYSIYRGFWSGGETLLTKVGLTTSYVDTGLTNGVGYYYRITASNPAGEGPMSNEAVAVPSTVPSPPTIASAIGVDREVVLTILPPSDTGGLPIISYKMYRGLSPGGEVYLVNIGTPTKHFDAGLTNGVMYCYKLSSVNANGESGLSGEACATPLAVPSPPSNIVATEGNSQVQLAWAAPSDDGGSPITAYKVYRSLISGGETLLATLGNVLAYSDSAVTNGLTYFYMVSASNSAGEGAKSVEVSATPHPPPTIPGAPENLQAAAGFGMVTLSWQQPADDGGEAITSYTIYRGTTPSTLSQIGTVAGSVTEYGDMGVTAGTTYYYQASATNLIGEGPRSNTASATMPGPPGQPTGLAVTAGTLQATLTWSAPASDGGSPITNYRIYRGVSSGAYSPVAMTGNVLTYTDTGLAGGQTYYYSVSAVNSIGEGQKSAEQSVSIAQPPNVPPACSISAPAQGTTVSGTVTVQGTASDQDGNVLLVEVRIDGGEWRGVYGTGPWSFRWNTKFLSNGEHTIDARAYDGNDFSQIVSVTVSVDNPAEAGPVSVQSNAAGIAAIVALVILAVLLGYLVFRRKPGQKKEKVRKTSPPPEEEQAEVRTEVAGEAIAPDKGTAERGISDDGFLDDDDELT